MGRSIDIIIKKILTLTLNMCPVAEIEINLNVLATDIINEQKLRGEFGGCKWLL